MAVAPRQAAPAGCLPTAQWEPSEPMAAPLHFLKLSQVVQAAAERMALDQCSPLGPEVVAPLHCLKQRLRAEQMEAVLEAHLLAAQSVPSVVDRAREGLLRKAPVAAVLLVPLAVLVPTVQCLQARWVTAGLKVRAEPSYQCLPWVRCQVALAVQEHQGVPRAAAATHHLVEAVRLQSIQTGLEEPLDSRQVPAELPGQGA